MRRTDHTVKQEALPIDAASVIRTEREYLHRDIVGWSHTGVTIVITGCTDLSPEASDNKGMR